MEIVVHAVIKVNPPYTSSGAKRKTVDDIVNAFSSAGFENIERCPIYDLKKGWIVKNGSVEYILINGSKDFKRSNKVKVSDKVSVYFHTFA